jgi:phosphotransacetylase
MNDVQAAVDYIMERRMRTVRQEGEMQPDAAFSKRIANENTLDKIELNK